MNENIRKAIREIYKNYLPILLKQKPSRIDPYIFPFDIPMTPIEENVWGDIRNIGLPFFMQVPVGPYFIDFGDPINKIGIEVDGKEFHQDLEKDESREKELNGMGWIIYRIPGNVTFKTRQDYIPDGYAESEHDEGDLQKRLESFYSECAEGILTQIKTKHYNQ